MSILINRKTKVIVQGLTGKTGSFFAQDMIKYGTKVVAGVTPGKGGIVHNGIPVYDMVLNAIEDTFADASIIFVPAASAKDSILEAIDAGIKLIVYPGENIPMHDMMIIKKRLNESNSLLIGPNTPGIITPNECKIGFMPYFCYKKGNVGVISKSGSLSYEISYNLTKNGIGQSTVVGIGGDVLKGLDFLDVFKIFLKDKKTKIIVLIGEIGGNDEERVASFIGNNEVKPVIAFVTGKSAPVEKKMGHASAIITEGMGSYKNKVKKLKEAGILVAKTPFDMPRLVKRHLN
jgi:succinyl-CoA synthetase alpha subunit